MSTEPTQVTTDVTSGQLDLFPLPTLCFQQENVCFLSAQVINKIATRFITRVEKPILPTSVILMYLHCTYFPIHSHQFPSRSELKYTEYTIVCSRRFFIIFNKGVDFAIQG